MNYRYFFIALLCFTLAQIAYAQRSKQAQFMGQVYKLPAAIYDVKGMGNWQKGSAAGQVRLVIARSTRRDEVYVQWVRWDEKGPAEVKSTKMIKELQDTANYKVTFIRRETIAGKRQIVLGLENLYDRSSDRLHLHVTDVGRYSAQFK